MPSLANSRWEAFCQNTIQGLKHGWSQGECYQRAGYRARGHSAEQLASQLLRNVEVKSRMAELQAPIARKAQITAESLLDRLEANIEAASAEKQHGAVNGAIRLCAELRGLMVDRVEIGGPGDFAGIQSLEDVAGAMVREMGAPVALETLNELRASVEALAAHQAIEVAPSYRRRDEVGPALKTLRNR